MLLPAFINYLKNCIYQNCAQLDFWWCNIWKFRNTLTQN